MPGLYSITANTGRVAVSNTTGLYIGSGAVAVLNNAQQLLNLLSNSSTISFYLDSTTGNTTVTGIAIAPTYGNANVAAFLPTYTGSLGGTLTTAAQPNVTSLGTLSSLTVAGLSTLATANVTTLNVSGLTTATGGVRTATIESPYTPSATRSTVIFDAAGNFDIKPIGATSTATTNSYGDLHVIQSLGNPYKPNLTVDGNIRANGIVSIVGNIASTTGYFIGNGSLLTGVITNSYTNANVAAYLPVYGGNILAANITSNTLSVTSSIQSSNLSVTNNIVTNSMTATSIVAANTFISTGSSGNISGANYISGNFFVGNGSLLTGISAGTNYTNANVAAYLPTYTGNLVSLTGAVTTTANVTGSYFIGNGSLLTGISAGTNYTNANVAAYLPTYTGAMTSMAGDVTTTANVTGSYFIGNGALLTGISAGTNYTNANVAAYLPTYTGNLASATGPVGGTLTTAAQPNVTSVGTLTSLTSSGNITGANLVSTGSITAPGTFYSGNIITGGVSGNISGANYVSANYFVGDGSLLTNVAGGGNYSNVNVAAYLPTYTGNLSAGNLSLSGIVSSNFKVADVQFTSIPVSGVGNVTSKFAVNQVGATNIATASFYRNSTALEPFFTAGRNNSNDPAVLGNVTTNMNLFTLGALGVIGSNNKSFAQLIFGSNSTGTLSDTSAPGRITFLTTADGSTTPRQVMRLNAAGLAFFNYDAQVSANLTAGNIATTGVITAGSLSGNGAGLTNITGANVTGTVNAAQYVLGLTSGNVTTALGYVPADSNTASSYGNANVAAYLPTYIGNLVSLAGDVTTTANVTGAYVIGNGSALTSLSGAAVTGTVANAAYATNAGSANFATTATSATYVTGLTSANVTTALGYTPLDSNSYTAYGNTQVAAYLPTYTGAMTAMTGAVTTTANVTGAYIIGNGSQLTNLPTQPGTYTNANVAAYLPTYTGNLVSLTGAVITTANVQANYFLGNGSQLTGISTTPAAGTVFNPFLLAGM